MMVCVRCPRFAPDTCPMPPDTGHPPLCRTLVQRPQTQDTHYWCRTLIWCLTTVGTGHLHTAGVSGANQEIGYCDLGTPAESGGAQHPRGTAPISKFATLWGISTRDTVSLQPGSPRGRTQRTSRHLVTTQHTFKRGKVSQPPVRIGMPWSTLVTAPRTFLLQGS